MINKDIEQYNNIISLLEQALIFYANKDKYIGDISSIDLDAGLQARFALSKLKDFNEMNQKLDAEYIKEIEKLSGDNTIDSNVLKIIEDIKLI